MKEALLVQKEQVGRLAAEHEDALKRRVEEVSREREDQLRKMSHGEERGWTNA